MSYLTHIVCLQCKHEFELGETFPTSCPRCKSAWLDACYDYEAVTPIWKQGLDGRERSLWRYHELLPLTTPDPEISLSEGFTPLLRLLHYEKSFNHEHLYVKDERNNPTNSFKDRQAALSVTNMRRQGINECVLASTGNAAVAYAAYCARAGIKLWLFLTSLAPAEKMREVALYGAEVVKVSGTYDETKKVAAEFSARKGIYMDKGAKTIPSKESMKTLAFEIAEQLGMKFYPDQPGRWIAPDWYIQAVSGGIGPLGVWKGFQELYQMGLIDKMPKLGIIQAAGCAPMVQAFHEGLENASPVVPKTLIHVLATGDPDYAYVLLREAALSNGGTMVAIEDGETFRAMRQLASRTGISVEPATAVAFAGLEKMLLDGTIQPGEVVSINCSGHTIPAESHILGDQFDKYILDLEINNAATPREEGLGAALQNLSERVTTIVIVDDNPNDRRLIRRLLQSYKNYRVYEATNGAEGLEVIRDRKPDLVVADLTMPEMDGFTLLEQLKHDPEIAHIPVVVVSAKSLTAQDREILETYSNSIWTKGGFDTRQLVDHVVNTLGHAPVEVIRSARKEKPIATIAPQPEIVDRENNSVIVVIDDNPQDLRLAAKLLRLNAQYQVIETLSGRDGLKAIYNYHPDLVILDLQLPDIDGFSILEALQKDSKLRDIPVIIVSGRSLTPKEQEIYKSNIRSIIEKASLDQQQFIDIIKNELR
ncbi:MAG: pyridoxal-phosphate dependent enzyme [Anaerolineae bacterium]|jgi:threonine synthase|nr:pyridoxal-phosphate dependent enzyme [Anaerolineae bacterium]